MEPVEQWEMTYIQADTFSVDTLVEAANKLAAVGWEPVGLAGIDKTIGINKTAMLLKRRITDPIPPATTDEIWQEDPTGRFDKRRWNPRLKVWTAETATVADKSLHVDAPWA